jgi:hypothetical protein
MTAGVQVNGVRWGMQDRWGIQDERRARARAYVRKSSLEARR